MVESGRRISKKVNAKAKVEGDEKEYRYAFNPNKRPLLVPVSHMNLRRVERVAYYVLSFTLNILQVFKLGKNRFRGDYL